MSKKTSNRFNRKYNEKEEQKIIYIFTEGEETESNYFKSIKKDLRLTNIEIIGTGFNTLSLVNYAIKKGKNKKKSEIWVVFDKDDFDKDFNAAIIKAKSNNIQVAYSNESFELWFILHFCYMSTALKRDLYCKKLNTIFLKKIGKKYEKNSKDIYSLIKMLESTAIKNAETLLKSYGNEKSDVKKNPSTTVHFLVSRLNKLSE